MKGCGIRSVAGAGGFELEVDWAGRTAADAGGVLLEQQGCVCE